MEKITEESVADMTLSDWLRVAIASVATSKGRELLFPASHGWTGTDGNNYCCECRRFHAIHAHSHPEVAISTGGRTVMELHDGPVPMDYPSVMAVEPELMHCHAGSDAAGAHATMWLVFSGDSVLVQNILYVPSGRWLARDRIHRSGRSIEQFRDNLSSGFYAASERGGERFRMELMDILHQAYQHLARAELAGSGGGAPEAVNTPLIEYIASYIKDNLREDITLKFLGQVARLSPNHLNSLFKNHYGVTIHAFLIRCRMDHSMELLRNTTLRVKQVARQAGYEDPLYFSRAFRDYYGIWPSEARTSRSSTFSKV